MYKLIKLIQEKQIATALAPSSSDTSSTIQPGIIQESNDGVSTSYNTLSAKEAAETITKELENTVKMYLQGVRTSLGHRLLYRGVYPDE